MTLVIVNRIHLLIVFLILIGFLFHLASVGRKRYGETNIALGWDKKTVDDVPTAIRCIQKAKGRWMMWSGLVLTQMHLLRLTEWSGSFLSVRHHELLSKGREDRCHVRLRR